MRRRRHGAKTTASRRSRLGSRRRRRHVPSRPLCRRRHPHPSPAAPRESDAARCAVYWADDYTPSRACHARCLRRCRSVACWPAPCRRLVARGRRESRARPRLIDRTGRVAGSEGTRAAVHTATVCARLDGDQQGCVWALSAPNARMQRCVRALSACVSCGRRHLA